MSACKEPPFVKSTAKKNPAPTRFSDRSPSRSTGRTLKSITDSTGAHIQIPRDDELEESVSGPGAGHEGNVDGADDDEASSLGPLISISVSGSQSAVEAARAQILAIVRERTAKTTTKLPDVPSELWALLAARVPQILERAGAGQAGPDADADVDAADASPAPVKVDVPRRTIGRSGVDVVKDSGDGADALPAPAAAGGAANKAVSVSGDKDLVKRVVHEIETELAELVRGVLFNPRPLVVFRTPVPFPLTARVCVRSPLISTHLVTGTVTASLSILQSAARDRAPGHVPAPEAPAPFPRRVRDCGPDPPRDGMRRRSPSRRESERGRGRAWTGSRNGQGDADGESKFCPPPPRPHRLAP